MAPSVFTSLWSNDDKGETGEDWADALDQAPSTSTNIFVAHYGSGSRSLGLIFNCFFGREAPF